MAASATMPRQFPPARRVMYSLLIAPEALLISVLLLLDSLLHSPAIGLLISFLIISFITRIAALRLAAGALQRMRWHTAESLARVALALHPWSADALALQGIAALLAGNAGRSITALRRASRLAPENTALLGMLSGALLEQGQTSEAEAAARRALMLDSANAIAHLHLAQALASRNCPPEAIEDQLRQGLQLQPAPDAEAALRCALARHLARVGRIAEATLALSCARALLPRCSAVQRAWLRQQMEELTFTPDLDPVA